MSKLTIVAHIKAKSDQIELVKTELEKLIEVAGGKAVCNTICTRTTRIPLFSCSTRTGDHGISGRRTWAISI